MNKCRALFTAGDAASLLLKRNAGSRSRFDKIQQNWVPATVRYLHRTESPSKSPFINLFLRNARRRSLRHWLSKQRRLFSDTNPPSPTTGTKALDDSSLSGRLRKLSREYGWSALGIYLFLSALDFPFCFLAVRWLGTERIGRWEHAIVEYLKRAIPFQWPESWGGKARLTRKQEQVEELEVAMGYDHGVKAAQEKNSEGATLWTQLALAYAIHKSFIFIRVPITAAITPKVVKTLRGWGWNIGKRTPKPKTGAATQAVDANKTL